MKTNKPSQTARKVAFNIIALGGEETTAKLLPPGLADATGQLLVAAGTASEKTVRMVRGMAWVYRAFDWMMPGQYEAFALRKAFCETQVREAIADGATQVLMLGAGYDTLGWRLAPAFPDVRFFEVDHPATARVKARGIQVMGPRSNLHLISADLSEHSLVEVLGDAAAWRCDAPSVVVAEGLLMYLPCAAVAELFCRCARISGPHSRVVFTYVSVGRGGRPDAGPFSWLVRGLLKAGGEPWLWGIRPEELGEFLAPLGWATTRTLAGIPGVERFGVTSKDSADDY